MKMNVPKTIIRFINDHARSDYEKKTALSLLHALTFSIAEFDAPRNAAIEQQLFSLLGFLAGPGAGVAISPATQLLMNEFRRIFQLEKSKQLEQLAATTIDSESEDEDVRELARLTKKIAQKLNRRAVPY